jgi:hypothetical protein
MKTFRSSHSTFFMAFSDTRPSSQANRVSVFTTASATLTFAGG